jgi:hypothetical protein
VLEAGFDAPAWGKILQRLARTSQNFGNPEKNQALPTGPCERLRSTKLQWKQK